MLSQNELKLCLLVLVMLGSLYVFDSASNYAYNQITGAATSEQVTDRAIKAALSDDEQAYFLLSKPAPGVADIVYKVRASYVGDKVVFEVNNQLTDALGVFDAYTFQDQTQLAVLSKDSNKVVFAITASVPEVTVIDENTLKAALADTGNARYALRKPGAEDIVYDVTAQFVAGNKVRFTINNEQTQELGLADRFEFGLSQLIVSTKTEKKVEFTITGSFPDVTLSNNNILRSTLSHTNPTQRFVVDGKTYDISARFSGDSTTGYRVNFIVNGKVTSRMNQGDIFTFRDSSFVTVSSIHPAPSVIFAFGKEGSPEAPVVSQFQSGIVYFKSDAFSLGALGAAFGSYYDGAKSTCRAEDFNIQSLIYSPTYGKFININLYRLNDASAVPVTKTQGHKQDLLRLGEAGDRYFKAGVVGNTEAVGAWMNYKGQSTCNFALTYTDQKLTEIEENSGLHAGWNLYSVVPQMVTKTFADIYVNGDCKILGTFSNYKHTRPSSGNAVTTGDYDIWGPGHVFRADEVGMAMWILTENSCNLDLLS